MEAAVSVGDGGGCSVGESDSGDNSFWGGGWSLNSDDFSVGEDVGLVAWLWDVKSDFFRLGVHDSD